LTDENEIDQEEKELPPNVDTLKKIEELETKNEEYVNRLKYLQADFDNYKKRVTNDRKELIALASERLVRELLNLMDDFERALEHENDNTDDETKSQGIKMIYEQLRELIEKEGVTEIDTDCQLDPFEHEVVSRVSDPEYQDNDIMNCLQKGYKMGGKVIRPAKVVVCRRQDDKRGKKKIDVKDDDDTDVESELELG